MLGLLPQRWRIETDTAVCCAAGAVQDGVLRLQELLPDVLEAAAALAARLGCTRAEVCTTGGDRPFAMAKALARLPCPSGRIWAFPLHNLHFSVENRQKMRYNRKPNLQKVGRSMNFGDFLGNDGIKQRLNEAERAGRLSHAWLLI